MKIISFVFHAITVIFLISCAKTQKEQSTDFVFYPKTTVELFEINSVDVYSDNVTLHALIAGTLSEKEKQNRVFYLQSQDEGVHWSQPILVSKKENSPLVSRGNDLQIAAHGKNLMAIWQSMGELPNTGALVSFYSHDGGKTWNQGKNPAFDNNGDQSHADLIADKMGLFHAVWLADPEENGYQSLRYNHSSDGENWQAPLKLDDSTCSCCSNTLATSPNNQLHVLYRDMKPRDMAILSSDNNGQSWQFKQTAGEFNWQFDGCPHIGGGLTFDADNHFYSSVWTGAPEKSGLYVFTPKIGIKMSKNAMHSDILSLEEKIIVIWDEISSEGTGIFISESSDRGESWTNPHKLSTKHTIATHPHLIKVNNKTFAYWTEKQAKQTSQWIWYEIF